jgi:signal transduction histidine kinase/ActR/RegA family two-component response regulator
MGTESAPWSIERRVLIWAPSGRDAALVGQVFEQAGIAALVCADRGAFIAGMVEGAGAGVLAQEALSPKAIAALSSVLREQPAWSDFPLLIFTARTASADENRRTLEAFVDLGNVTALERPIHPLTMVSAVRAALRARVRQYAARQALAERDAEVKQRDQFLAMLGHELRNPLGAMRNAALIAEQHARSGKDARRPLTIIDRQLRHLTQLVDDLLEVARVTSGKIALKLVPVDLVELSRATVDDVGRGGGGDDRLRIDVRVPDGEVVVMGDPVRLAQILGNLLTNALKYTPAPGRIGVSVIRDEGRALLRVTDAGVGISPDIMPTIFEPFTQAVHSLDRAQGGMGLGLSVVRALARLHRGDVEVQSAGLGRGSTFTVSLPLAEGLPTGEAEPREEPAPPTVSPRHILIVEDGVDHRETLQELLEAEGHAVITAADGEGGVEQALALRPEVALVDIGLPRLDGYEVARRIRQAIGPGILLIALTGYGQPDDKARAWAAGFDVHVTKPLDLDVLERLIARAPAAAEPIGVPPAPR